MTEEELPPPSDADLEAQEQEMKKLLASERAPTAPAAPLLPAVQRKIRKRSKGKFYSDGWSVEAGRINYVLVATLMLFILAVAYFALGPTGISR